MTITMKRVQNTLKALCFFSETVFVFNVFFIDIPNRPNFYFDLKLEALRYEMLAYDFKFMKG